MVYHTTQQILKLRLRNSRGKSKRHSKLPKTETTSTELSTGGDTENANDEIYAEAPQEQKLKEILKLVN